MDSQNSKLLLREKAIAHKMQGPISSPVVGLKNYFKLQLSLWLLLLLITTYLLTRTSYRETVAAKGVLEPVQGTQKIVSPIAARVEEIHVSQGQRVERGDILASLSTDSYNGQGSSALQENIQQLKIDRELLAKQLEVQRIAERQSSRWNKLATANVLASSESLGKEIELLATRTQLSDRNLQAISMLLEAGNSSSREFDRQYQAHLELLGRVQTLSRRQLQYEHELNSLNNTQQLAEADAEQASLQYQRELQAIDQRIMNLSDQALFTVVAQDRGIVAALGLERGTSVLANQPLFFIHPGQSELQATLYVPAALQAKLVTGQTVLLRYDAFDYRLYGRAQATVSVIGQARLDPRETTLPIFGVTEPVFKIIAELHQATIEGESQYQLKPGTTLTADFVLWEMSLLKFIFKPILGLQGKIT